MSSTKSNSMKAGAVKKRKINRVSRPAAEMAIKVLVGRRVKAGHEDIVWEMLRDLRGQAVRQKGYLYGKTWRSLDDSRIFLVSST